MSIATSIEKLNETLTNCKANLKEKEVADVDNIKISDVDEKIAEIQAGGGGIDISNSDLSSYCILVIEVTVYGTLNSFNGLSPSPSRVFGAEESPYNGTLMLICIYRTQQENQEINFQVEYTDGEEPETHNYKISNVNLSKPGLFYYKAKKEF